MAKGEQQQIEGSLQENLLTLLVFKPSATLIRNTVSIDLYSSPIYRRIVQRVYDYVDRFKKPPGDHFPDLLEDMVEDERSGELVRDIVMQVGELENTVNEEYILAQLGTFVRKQQLQIGIAEAMESISRGQLDEAEVAIEKAMRARLDLFDPGIQLDEVITQMKKEPMRKALVLGIRPFDDAGLGPARKEIHNFQAPTGRGKSWYLTHCGKRALISRLKVAVVTLELSAMLYGARFLMNLFGVASRRKHGGFDVTHLELQKDGTLSEITVQKLKKVFVLRNARHLRQIEKRLREFHPFRNLIIKEFPTRGLTIPGLRAYLDSLERSRNFTPDLLIVDYPKLFKIAQEDFRLGLGIVNEELRGIAVERNCMLQIASQSNREGARAKLVRDTHASEDWSQMGTADGIITYSQTAAEERLGLARLFAQKGRTERDKFSCLITQHYPTGQFVLDATLMRNTYWTQIKAADMSGEEDTEDA